MSPALFLASAALGGLGAAARFLVDRALTRAHPDADAGPRFPRGIAAVNLSGSLLLGLLVGLAAALPLSSAWTTALGAGLLGGYTTLSTASVDSVRLALGGRRLLAAGNALGVTALCVLAALLGVIAGDAAAGLFPR